MMISRRSFLKCSAAAGAAALQLAFPLAAHAEAGTEQQNGGVGGVEIVQSTAEDGYLRMTLNTVSRSVFGDTEPSCLVMLGFTVTNLTSEPVWLYHLHANVFGEYEDGSEDLKGTFGDGTVEAQLTRSDKMTKIDQSSPDGSDLCVFYGVDPGQTIGVSATGSMSNGTGTMTLSFTPPEQTGANAAVHNSTYTFTVNFNESCGSTDLQMAYL